MSELKHTIKIFFGILFFLYLGLLAKNILFKKSPGYYKRYFRKEYRHYEIENGWRTANTIPFSTIRLFYNSRRLNSEYKRNNIFGNLLGFLPLGFLLPFLVHSFRNGFKILWISLFISLCFETAQLVFGLGIFDVDDLILNTTGGLTGYLLFWIISRKINKDHTKNSIAPA